MADGDKVPFVILATNIIEGKDNSQREFEKEEDAQKEAQRLTKLEDGGVDEERRYYKKESRRTSEDLLDSNQIHHIGRERSKTFAKDKWTLRQIAECKVEAQGESAMRRRWFRATTDCEPEKKEILENSVSLLMEEYRTYSYFQPIERFVPRVVVDPESGKLVIEGDAELIHHLQCLGLAHYFCIPPKKRIWDRKKTTRIHPLLMRLYSCLPLFRTSLRNYPFCDYFGPYDPNQLYCFAMIMASWCNHTYWFINADRLLQFVMTPKDPHFHLYNHIHRVVDIYFDKDENFVVSARTQGLFAHVGRMLTMRGLRYMHEKAYFTLTAWYKRTFITGEQAVFTVIHKRALNHFRLRDTNPRLLKYACTKHPRTGEKLIDLHILCLLLNKEEQVASFFEEEPATIIDFVPNFYLMALDMFVINSTLSRQLVSSLLHEFDLDNQQLVSIINPALVPTPEDATKREKAVHRKVQKNYIQPDDRPPPFYLYINTVRREEMPAEVGLRNNIFRFTSIPDHRFKSKEEKQAEREAEKLSNPKSLTKAMVKRNIATAEYEKQHGLVPVNERERPDPKAEDVFYIAKQQELNHPTSHRRPTTYDERVLTHHYDCSYILSNRCPPKSATDAFFKAIGSNVTAASSLCANPFVNDPYEPFADADHFDVNEKRVIFGGPSCGYTMIDTTRDCRKRKRAYFPPDFHRTNKLPKGFKLDLDCSSESESDEEASSVEKRQRMSDDPFSPHSSQIVRYSSFVKDDELLSSEDEDSFSSSSSSKDQSSFEEKKEEDDELSTDEEESEYSFSSSSRDQSSFEEKKEEDDDEVFSPEELEFRRARGLVINKFHQFDPDKPDEDDEHRPFPTMARRRAARIKDHDRKKEEYEIKDYESLGDETKKKTRADRFSGVDDFDETNSVFYEHLVRTPITESPFLCRFNKHTDRLYPLLAMLSILDYEVMRRRLVTHRDQIHMVPFCTTVDPTVPDSFACTNYLKAGYIDLPIDVHVLGSLNRDGELDIDLLQVISFHRAIYLKQ